MRLRRSLMNKNKQVVGYIIASGGKVGRIGATHGFRRRMQKIWRLWIDGLRREVKGLCG
jgi:hypothetical protein